METKASSRRAGDELNAALASKWKDLDAIVIGSGFGGAAAALPLARAGKRVLLVERGGWPKRDAGDWDGRKILIDQRYKSDSHYLIKQYASKSYQRKFPEEVVGGMSIFFGGAAFRFRENDFRNWPIRYSDLESYYCQAEKLLEVHGELGPQETEPPRSAPLPHPPIPLRGPAAKIHRIATGMGYRPYRLPTAINFTNAKRTLCILCNTCDGFPCRIEAKLDAITALIHQAQKHGLEILTGVVAIRLIEENGKITSVECADKSNGEVFRLSAKEFIVSGGALQSPALLLRSGLERFPGYDLIGRNLMRHANAFVSYVFPFRTRSSEIFHKQLVFADFYERFRAVSGFSGGNIQDNCMPSGEIISHFAPKGLKRIAGVLSKNIQGLLVIAEDEPQLENRVTLSTHEKDPYGVPLTQIDHRYSRGDLERRDFLIRHARRILRRAGGIASNIFEVDTFSHAVGTVRFGNDPKTSVLDPACTFHGVANLSVLDASFMPSSAGLNPSLTIVANSLRVGEKIVEKLK